MTLFLLSLAYLQATASENQPLIIQLQQAVDTHCDDVIDTPYSANQPLSILPNQCVMYKIIVKNTSTKDLNEVAIKGNIPPYTTLRDNRISAYKGTELQTNIISHDLDSAQINVKLTKLSSFQTVTIFYSVYVN